MARNPGLVLRLPHDPMPLGATVSTGRLSIQQMDENLIFLQNLVTSLTQITYSEAQALIETSSVVAGQSYLITDADPLLYGSSSSFNFGPGTNIIIKGLSENTFSSNGWGKFYNPKYDTYNIWDADNSYTYLSTIIYGGRVWKKNSTDVPHQNNDVIDYLNLDTNYWTPQDYNDTSFYNVAWDEIEFDMVGNFMISRYESRNNNLIRSSKLTSYFFCEIYPIQAFRWGHTIDFFGEYQNGVENCELIDSYLGCLNFISGYIVNINMRGSMMFDIKMSGTSYMENIEMRNSYSYGLSILTSSIIQGLIMNNSGIIDITLTNNSYIYNIDLFDSSITNGTLDDASYITDMEISLVSSIRDFTMVGGSHILNSKISNLSAIESFSMYSGSRIQNVDVSNWSTINNFNLYNNIDNTILSGTSHIGFFSVNDLSYIDFINISNSSFMSFFNLYSESSLTRISIDNDSYIDFGNNTLSNSYLYGIKIENNSSIQFYDTLSNSNLNNIHMIDSYLGNIMLTDSHMTKINLINSYIENITMLNYSDISNINLKDSSITDTTIDHNNGIYGLNSESSSISNVQLLTSGLEFFYMKDANFRNYVSMNDIWAIHMNMSGSTFDFNGITYSIPAYTEFNSNTIKYKFSINFDGTEGLGQVGQVSIPKLLVPYHSGLGPYMSGYSQGWYIEKVIIDNSNTNGGNLASDSDAYLNLGISEDTQSAMEAKLISEISGRVRVYDISNENANGSKSTGASLISMSVDASGADIKSGAILLEITLKNTNYGTNND